MDVGADSHSPPQDDRSMHGPARVVCPIVSSRRTPSPPDLHQLRWCPFGRSSGVLIHEGIGRRAAQRPPADEPGGVESGEGEAWPVWVGASLARSPWAVVRRAPALPGFVAVGLRGAGWARRWGAALSASGVLEARAPDSLRCLEMWEALPDVAAVRSLRAVAPTLERAGIP